MANGVRGGEIVCKRGLRQGDPLSPLIFVFVADSLHHMIARCRKEGLLKGLGCRDESYVVINLQYVDDTLLFGKESLPQAMILKWELM